MYIQRDLESTLQKYVQQKEIIAVIGPRQSGKSTLLLHLLEKLPDTHIISFDDLEVLNLFEHDTKAFIELHIKKYQYVLIDEVQYSKNSGKILKYIYDTGSTKLFLSGSSATEFSLQSLRFLVGRIFVFYLYPLSFSEFIRYKNNGLFALLEQSHFKTPTVEQLNTLLDEFVRYGGYPRVVLAGDAEEKKIVLKNIYNTYFLREIKEILQVSEDYKLSLLLKALSLQTGNMLNYTELCQLSGFSYSELRQHLNILEKTFICSLLRPFHTNKRTELVKNPKVYFFDTGFLNVVIPNFSPDRTDQGALYENFVYTELLKKGFIPKYWRTKAKAEVDFIIEQNNLPIPIEVKSNSDKLTRSYQSFLDTYQPRQGFLVSRFTSGKEQVGKTSIRFLPLVGIAKIELFIKH